MNSFDFRGLELILQKPFIDSDACRNDFTVIFPEGVVKQKWCAIENITPGGVQKHMHFIHVTYQHLNSIVAV